MIYYEKRIAENVRNPLPLSILLDMDELNLCRPACICPCAYILDYSLTPVTFLRNPVHAESSFRGLCVVADSLFPRTLCFCVLTVT